MQKIQSRIKNDHRLALDLYDTRIYDAIFLVTGPDGSVVQQTIVGNVLLVPPADAGTVKDANGVFYVDLACAPGKNDR